MKERDERDEEIDVPKTPTTDEELLKLPVLDLNTFYKSKRSRERRPRRHRHHYLLCACWVSELK